MTDLFSPGVGIAGCFLTSLVSTANEIVGIICTSAIALVTCFLQIYRMLRDRDTDLKASKTSKRKTLTEDEKLSNIVT